MVRHIAMFWFRDAEPAAVSGVLGPVRALLGAVPGLRQIEVEPALPDVSGATGLPSLLVTLVFDTQAANDAFLGSIDALPIAQRLRMLSTRIEAASYQIERAPRRMPRLLAFVGPSNREEETLLPLVDIGLSGIRLSLLHHTLKECIQIAEAFHTVTARRGILPEVLIDHASLQSLPDAIKGLGATGVIAYPPRDEALLADLRKTIGPDVKLLMKLDTEDDLAAGEMLSRADEVIIDRDGLARNLPWHVLPTVQRQAATLLRGMGKPFIVASDLLSSMRDSLAPSVPEISDVHTAILEGASALMISREVSQGRYPQDALKTLKRVAEAAIQGADL